MKRTIICLLLLYIEFAAVAAAADTYYVAPQGSNTNPGTPDRPFATLQHAVLAARANGGRHIKLSAGTHRLTAPLVLTPHDSGTREQPLVIEGDATQESVISGGR